MAATEFDDSQHYGIFTTSATLTSSTGKMVRQSELVLSALRAQGVFDNLIDSTTAPAHDKLWLDKNSDPAVLKEWDSISSTWQAMTFDRLFGRAVITDFTNVGGTADAITVDAPDNFIDNRLYGLVPIATNTGGVNSVTIQVAGVGTYDVVYPNGDDLSAGELAADLRTPLLFTNGRFEIVFGANAGSIKRSESDASAFLFVVDEDDMASNSATLLPTQQSVKAYVDDRVNPNAAFAAAYSAVGDGTTDDSTAIQAAIDAAAALGGGTVYLEAKTYGLSSQIALKENVRLFGQGCGQYPPAAFLADSDFLALGKTRLKALAGFPASTPMVEVKTADSAKYVLQGVRLNGFMIDCDNVADYGLNAISIKNCWFKDLLVMRPKTRGILEDCLVNDQSGTARGGTSTTMQLANTASTRDDLYNGLSVTISSGTGSGQTKTISDYVGSTQTITVSTWTTTPDATSVYTITGKSVTEGNGATQFNVWEGVNVYCGSSGSVIGWVQDGNPTNNVNQNHYYGCRVIHADGDGFDLKNCDTNNWFQTVTFAFGTGYGARLRGNATNNVETCHANTWFGTQFAGPGSGQGGVYAEAGSGGVSNFNVMLGYSTQNATDLPTIEDGARLRIYPDLYEYNADPVQVRRYSTKTAAYATGVFGTDIWRVKLGSGTLTEVATHDVSMAGSSGSEVSTQAFKTYNSGALATQFEVKPEGIAIGGGANLKKILTATAAIDFTSIAAGSLQNQTMTVTGAATGDSVVLGLPSNGFANGIAVKAYVSAADTVTIQAINTTASAIDPASLSVRATVFKF